jgi:biopolymer transport protein ExbD
VKLWHFLSKNIMLKKKNKRGSGGEFNASSMADIAFLLLIFFLMVTTIDTSKGIPRRLPPLPVPDQPIVKFKQRNVFDIRVNARDQLLVENRYMQIYQLKDATKEFISNPFKKSNLAESPQNAVVSLKNDRGTSYDIYIQIQNELAKAYNELRNEKALELFGKAFDDLSKRQQKDITTIYPMKVSEAEPEDIGGK